MPTQRAANIVFALAVIVACLCFIWLARSFELTGFSRDAGLSAKFFPQLVLGFTGLCALVVAVLYAARGSAGGDAGQKVFAAPGDARRSALTLAAAVLSCGVWVNFGFLPMAALMGPLTLLAMGVRSAKTYMVVLALAAMVYVVFTRLLGVQLD